MTLLLTLLALYGPYLELPGEAVGYSFQLEDNSVVSFLTGAQNNYIIFRYGLPDSIYLEFPEDASSDSWDCFSANTYTRHGEEQNDGMTIATIAFTMNDSLIEVYDNYYSVGSVYSTGIRITVGTNTFFQETGVFDSRIGNLSQFLNNFYSWELL
ncbi:MAG: hypothetical protein K8S62_03320 [Candidatus Sabulitectum sp.]|nr:hypothetical protein [Candidatus Sabulitectum sp.]